MTPTTTTTSSTTKKPRSGKRPGVPAVPAATDQASPGLDALTGPGTGGVVSVPLEQVHPHPANPRRDLGDLDELADSIRAHGVRQNLLVVPDPDHSGQYRAVIGHRRAAASRLAGLTHVPAVVDDSLTEADQRELMLLENIQRSDLSPVEEADGYQGLLDLGVSAQHIADRTGRSLSTVQRRLRLVALPEPARDAVHEHRATLDDVATLAEFDDDTAETRERLVQALGTAEFSFTVTSARRRRERAEVWVPFVEALVAASIPSVDDHSPAEGMTVAGMAMTHSLTGSYDHPEAVYHVSAKRLHQVIDTAGPGWTYHLSAAADVLYVFRPVTLEEIAEAERRDAERDQAQADRERFARERDLAAAQNAARAAAAAELAEVSSTTRREFLTGLVGRKLTQAQTKALVAYTGTVLLTTAWAEEYMGVTGSGAVPGWLGVDADAIQEAHAGDPDPWVHVDEAVRAAITALEPSHRLLVALASTVEPIGQYQWANLTDDDPVHAAWYGLLADLGYTVSATEQAALDGELPTPPEATS